MHPEVDSHSGFCDNKHGHYTALDETLLSLTLCARHALSNAHDIFQTHIRTHKMRLAHRILPQHSRCRARMPGDQEGHAPRGGQLQRVLR